jgi:amidase
MARPSVPSRFLPGLLVLPLLACGLPGALQGQGAPDTPTPLALAEATVAELAAAMDAGTLTAERLVELSLARIEAYDRAGPRLNAVLWLNQGALESARALDVERREQGPRSPLHGIPVVLKDNVDTADLPTTAGSLLLAGSIPPDDAFIVRKLREAGAIVLAKVNMSEFAGGAVMSSISGPMRNPHDPLRTPSGSSGGTGVAIAAWYAPLGIGTDTGGSIRGPSTSNGIVGLKPTLGLLSRDGIVPLSLTFDTAGPMGRSVYDVAVMLGAMTGVDPADPATGASEGRAHADYTSFLDADALRGARIGIARDFMGADADVDWVVEAALATMRRAGATVVEVRYPGWFLEAKADWYTTLRWPDFRDQIEDYLATLRPGYPRTLADLIVRSKEITSPTPMGGMPNPVRWSLFEREEASGSTTDPGYLAMRDHGLPLARGIVEGILATDSLDAIVYPTSSTRPALAEGGEGGGGGWTSATNIANLTGFPDLVVPAGFVGGNLPVGISFLGPAFSEPRLLALGHAFEQATRARRRPTFTPALPGEDFQPAPPGGGR